MEPANRATENALFYNIDSTSYATSAVPGGYPGGTDGGANDSVAMVSGSPGDHTQGPAMLLKVMTGDSVSFGVNSFFVGGGTAGSNSSSLSSVLNTLAGGLVTLGAGGGENGVLSGLSNSSSGPVYAALSSFFPSYDSTLASKPKAYLNWMLLDNQFNYVSGNGQSGAIPVGNPNVLNTLATTIKLKHSGYLYIWVSNETQNWMVFFDNLSIEHFAGPMLEETHYYPFGLTMAGISDKALKTNYAENKYRFNDGTELQNKEFSDGSGLELYETDYRGYDPQLGRFWQIDPLGEINENYSPYSFGNDNPILLNDPLGLLSDSSHPQVLATATVTHAFNSLPSTPTSVTTGLADVRGGGSPGVSADAAPATVAAPIGSIGFKSGGDETASQDNGDHNTVTDIAYEINRFNPLAQAVNFGYTVFTGHDSYGVKQNTGQAAVNLAVTVPLGRAGGIVVEAEEAMTVYVSETSEGVIQYVGITNNLARREAEHLASKGINISPLLNVISRSDARAVEQALIEMHGLGKGGGTLLNKINSIATSNPQYAAALKRGYELLKNMGVQ
jgi:RHS repeat-associated protein